MKYTIGLDQSFTSSGFVVFDETGEVVDFNRACTDKTKTSFERAQFISDEFQKALQKWKPVRIAIEGLGFGGVGNATRDLAGLQHVIIVDALRAGYTIDQIHLLSPKTVKLQATGSGKASKQDMYKHLPEDVNAKFVAAGYKKTKGLYDLTDAYFIGKISIATKPIV